MIFTPFTIGFAALAVVLTIGYAVLMEVGAQGVEELYATQYEPQLIELDRQAVEAAYVQQITALFASWMKDGSGQPGRAVKGANQARRAYAASMKALEERTKKRDADVRH